MHERHIMRRTPTRDHARCLCVDRKGRVDFPFGTVDGGVSRRIDYDRWLKPVEQGRQAVRLVEIGGFADAAIGQDAAAGGRDHLAQRHQRAQQFLADLAVAAEYQNGHGT